MNWYIAVIKKYAVFAGRARRKEYWLFTLFNLLIAMGCGFLDGMLGMVGSLGLGPIGGIYSLAMLLPGIAVTVRRLHDTDRSGWWLLLAFIPLIGGIVIFVFMVLDSTPGNNRFGANPKN